jgi:hypothetical protein
MPAVGMDPELRPGKLERKPSHQRGRATDVSRPDLDRSLCGSAGECSGDLVAARLVVAPDLRVARAQAPLSSAIRGGGGERIVIRANPGVGDPPAAGLTSAVTVKVPVAPAGPAPSSSPSPRSGRPIGTSGWRYPASVARRSHG